ncbi:MAG TPA: hypothetical protein VFX50_11845 [Gemmatimonadales bacterium]|nr:hypothetical protein [Gemmatimonadales bacterium]
MGSTRHTVPTPSFELTHHGRLLGDLARGDLRWAVHLDTRPHPRQAANERGQVPLQGRLHFVRDDGQVRSTGWIFVEFGEHDILARFAEFSANELWQLLDSLA